MYLSKLPSPPRPWRPCLVAGTPLLPRIRVAPFRRRRQLLPPSAASSYGSHSKDSPRPPSNPPSSTKAPDVVRRWKKMPSGVRESAVPDTEEPPGMRESAVPNAEEPSGMRESASPDTEEPPPPTRWTVRAAPRKVASWVPRKTRSVVLLNLVTFIFASNIAVVKEAETMLDPDLFNMLRFTIAAIPFAPYLLKSLRDMQILIRGLELGIWVSMAYLAQAIGLVTADAGRSSFISALTVIIVPFLDGLLGAVIPVYTWLGAVLSLVGVSMLELSGSPPCVGDLLSLLSAFSFAVHMLRTEHISRSMKRENFLSLIGCEVFVVALVSASWYMFKCLIQNVQHWSFKAWPPTKFFGTLVSFPWPAILYTGIFSTSFCLLAEVAAMRDISATEAAIIYGLEPVWGAAFAWAMLGERWGIMGFFGATLIIAGSLMVQILGSIPGVSSGQLQHEQLNAIAETEGGLYE